MLNLAEAQPVVSPANNPPQWRNERRDSRTSRSSRNARRHSLKLEGKKLLQNLGIIKAKNPSSSLTPGERAVSPVDNQTVDEDKKKDKKRNFSFGMSKKDKEKKDAIPRGLEHIGEPSNAGARDAPTPNAAQAEQPKPSAVNTAKPAK